MDVFDHALFHVLRSDEFLYFGLGRSLRLELQLEMTAMTIFILDLWSNIWAKGNGFWENWEKRISGISVDTISVSGNFLKNQLDFFFLDVFFPGLYYVPLYCVIFFVTASTHWHHSLASDHPSFLTPIDTTFLHINTLLFTSPSADDDCHMTFESFWYQSHVFSIRLPSVLIVIQDNLSFVLNVYIF